MGFKISRTDNYTQLNFLDLVIRKFKNSFIAGGCFKNIFLGQTIKDIDLFFYSKIDFEEAVKEANKLDLLFIYRNDNVCCFEYEFKNGLVVKIEMNQKIFGKPEDIISQFDFTIAKIALFKDKVIDGEGADEWHWEDKLIFHDDFWEHLFFKRLVVDNDKIPYPESTYERLIKYMRYGYVPCKETRVKIAKSLVELQREVKFSEAFYALEGFD